MPRLLIAALLLITGCSPAGVVTSPSPVAATSAAAISPSAIAATATPTAFPTPSGTPDPRLHPAVSVSGGVFPVMTSIRLKLAVVDEAVVNAARFGVERYLNNIDQYRDGKSPVLPITGPFLAVVSAALKDSATPGVTRHFKLESLVVDHHVQKPWGTHAYVEVTVGIADRAVGGAAPDQHEIGKLRLTGDKLMVSDGWDFDHDRWFNGFGPLPLDEVRAGVRDAVNGYLREESWSPSFANVWTDLRTAYLRERAQRIVAIDRTKTPTQFFEGATASIDQFETIDGIWSGVATVTVKGTGVTIDAAGQMHRAAFERHLRVFLLGNWIPEVVDEQTASGEWASAGNLALEQIDQNRA